MELTVNPAVKMIRQYKRVEILVSPIETVFLESTSKMK
jgi:hypothetical protein